MRRIETKYLLKRSQVPRLTQLIRATFAQDLRQRTYPVHSLYFDTPEKECYFSKLDGTPLRYKVRLRHYEGAEHFLEWKVKIQEESIKRRLLIDPTTVEQAILFQWPHELVERPANFLQPSLEVHYQRSEFTTRDALVRVTIDENIAFRDPGEKLHWASTYGEDQAILELKTNLDGVSAMDIFELPRILGLQRQSLSKYADSLKVRGVV
jgi:hypothetical protein